MAQRSMKIGSEDSKAYFRNNRYSATSVDWPEIASPSQGAATGKKTEGKRQ
jgi:hypothetical protein